MNHDAEIVRAHVDRMRKGFRTGQWLTPLIFGVTVVLNAVRGDGSPLALYVAGSCITVLLFVAARFLDKDASYRRVLAFSTATLVLGFLGVYGEIAATGGAQSPYVSAFTLAVVGSAFIIPLRPRGIAIVYPLGMLGYVATLYLTTPPDVPPIAYHSAINTALWATVVSGLGALFHYRTLQEAFSWRSALREEARRADLGLERARIARDLHDHIGARLTGIALRAEREQRRLPADAHPALVWIEDTVRLCLEELRDTIWALSNSGRDARELVATLRRRAEDIADAAGLDLIWQIDDAVWNGTLSPGVSVALSAILREALTNTIRHSGAKHVTVMMERLEQVIRMEVSDDGRGLGENPNEGRGLNNMRTRAKEQHGDVRIEESEHGLKVVAEIPWREDLLQDQKAA